MTYQDVTPVTAPFALAVAAGGDEFPVTGRRPNLSWKLPAEVVAQLGFEIEADIAGETLQHQADGARHRFVEWPWPDLTSTQTVSWRVRVSHAQGITEWSPWALFEAGLFEEDWTAAWISAPDGHDRPVGERPANEFVHHFTLDRAAQRARLYATALGVYEVFVNGVRLGSELMPGSTSYDRTLYAQAMDAGPALQSGKNSIRFVLSDGWFRGRAGAFREEAKWGPETAIRAELRVMLEDGQTVVVGTDQGWQVAESHIVRADLMDGQTSDLRRVPRVIGQAVRGPLSAPPISWSPAPPVRVIEERSPRSITRLTPNDLVVDFGQNASGRVRLTQLGAESTSTRLVFGEHLGPDGQVTLTHLDAPAPDGTSVPFAQADEVISDGRPGAVFEPNHTVHAFQYVSVHRTGIELAEDDITMQVMHTDLEPVGDFSCNDDDLNRLWDIARWSLRGNIVDVPTDCPTRERAGWTGDWQIFLPTAVRLYEVDGFTRKWLQSVRDDQLDDGRIVNISPDPTRMRTIPNPGVDFATGSAGWGDAIVLVPWELYRTYEDTQVLHDCWDAMTRWVNFALSAAANHRHPTRIERSADAQPHERYIWDGTFHFGEWLEPTPVAEDGTPGPAMPDPMAWAMADKGEVGTAYLYRSVSTLAKIAGVLGRSDDEATYRSMAENVRSAWQTEFMDDNGRTPGDSQASYVRAISFDLAPSHLRALAADRLAQLISDADNHLSTGFLSTADLLPVLADTGHADIAHRLLWQRTTPSWMGMLDRGATTIWEEWEGVDRNGNAHASLNHYSKGAVIRYLHSHTLGLRPDEHAVAWDSFVVAPIVPPGLSWARGHLNSPQGLIEVAWEVADLEAILKVTVPGGSRATLRWGSEQVQVGPGVHELRAQPSQIVG
ncbi:family 78 glycoside hydrolase catalytic domain [Leifsonia aquatica]|uniref:family 78 glycoside hydrolase catalytic domain n=1 Tax=Leifsonia aquatica TaxID=144185 RepID=UPI0028AEF75E|nr:family 78 glycoside hydrolase catalytic domain [Leifsonia aquatica]